MASTPPPRRYTDDVPTPSAIEMRPIGWVRSPHRERHGTPRQACISAAPGDRPDERCRVVVEPEYREALSDLEGIERLWVLGWLHLNQGWSARVVPPRGPRVRRGLFATRAPHRPNPIGLSCAKVLSVEPDGVVFERLDLLDGTPVLDLKPYIPAFDSFEGADVGWIETVLSSP